MNLEHTTILVPQIDGGAIVRAATHDAHGGRKVARPEVAKGKYGISVGSRAWLISAWFGRSAVVEMMCVLYFICMRSEAT